MQKIILLVSFIALTQAGINEITQKNVDLFKYSPNDVYTLPEDVDDDKPPVIYNGAEMNAKTEVLENLNTGKKFKLQLKTQNGIDVQQVGKLKDSKTFVISGQYSFTGADGKRYKTRYTADEFGYHPMTELDLDIPEPIPAAAPAKQNTFKFLNQNLGNQDFFDRIAANKASLNVPASVPQLSTRFSVDQQTVNGPYSQTGFTTGGSIGQQTGYQTGYQTGLQTGPQSGYQIGYQTGPQIGLPGQTGTFDVNLQAPYTAFNSGLDGGNDYPSRNGFGPLRGSGQSGDDYSYGPQDLIDHGINGYNYNPPEIQLSSSF